MHFHFQGQFSSYMLINSKRKRLRHI